MNFLKIIGKIVFGLISLFFFILFITCVCSAALQLAVVVKSSSEEAIITSIGIVLSWLLFTLFFLLAMEIKIQRSREFYLKRMYRKLEKEVAKKLSFIARFEKDSRKILKGLENA